MNLDVIKYLLPIGAVSLGLGMLLGWPRKNGKEKYDERQLIEQGRGSQIAMLSGMVYVLCVYAGWIFEMIPEDYMAILVLFGMILMDIVYEGWCVFHDAYLRPDQSDAAYLGVSFVLGLNWGVLAWSNWNRDIQIAWINLLLAVSYMSKGVFYIIRRIILHCENRKEAEE